MSSLRWKINRIKMMSVCEVIFRFVRQLVLFIERRKVSKGWQPHPSGKVTYKAPLFDDSIDAVKDEWFKEFGEFEECEYEEAINKIHLFSNIEVVAKGQINWHKDPESGVVAPLVYGKDIDYRDESAVGNSKTLWELSRHKHLVPIAMAYALTGKSAYLDQVVRQIDDWIEQNPFGIGVNWCSSLEVSLRVIAWSFVHSLIQVRESKGLFEVSKNPDAIGVAIYQHVYFIFHYLSRFSSANNHLIGELTGIWVACKIFNLGHDGDEWAKFAKSELEKEAAKQVYSDGVSREQATYYHLWVNEYLLVAWLLGERFKDRFSDNFSKTVSKMTQFLNDLRPDEGEIPQIGDSDDGVVLTFHPQNKVDPYTDIFSTMQCIAGNSTGFNVFALTAKAFWLRKICKKRAGSSSGLPDIRWRSLPLVTYPNGGYVVFNDRELHAIFDSGSLGYPSIAAHGHADALSLCVSLGNTWWIVDPGTYSYHTEPEWRNYFRGTRAHNTLTIDNKDQSTIGGAFLWLKHARIEMGEVFSTQDGVITMSGTVCGFERGKERHTRRVKYVTESRMVFIDDEVEATDNRSIDIRFHFHPDVEVQVAAANKYVASKESGNLNLEIEVDTELDWNVSKGEVSPPLGWYSGSLGVKNKCFVLCGRSRISSKKRFITKMSWH